MPVVVMPKGCPSDTHEQANLIQLFPVPGLPKFRLKNQRHKEAVSFQPDDEDSSDLDLEQLLEEVGKELEQREEPQLGEDAEDFPMAFFGE
ncbi:hypothetical protein MC885_019798 [Smutsia gigantea]|nr:hypothetical protein MC885_019798 [Smutsia gigantea]